MSYSFIPLSQRPELCEQFWSTELTTAWPPFMHQDPVAELYYAAGRLDRYFEFVLALVDDAEPNCVIGRVMSVPFCLGEAYGRPELPDGGWDAVIRWADEDQFYGRAPNAVSALEITLPKRLRGQGLSGRCVAAMRDNVARMGISDLYAPVRPNRKHLEPKTPMSEYAWRTREDGLPHDAWLRVHVRLGAKIVKVAPYSMLVPGTLAEWREWTGLPFDKSGEVIVPNALAPVHVSVAQDSGVYVEPNVWLHHSVSSA